jgi:hypothetical protein
MREIFHIGGFGMYPTALFGLLLIGASIRYAVKPESRFVPLQITLGLLTLFAGALGFVTGLITSFSHLGELAGGDPNAKWIPLIGAAESLYNVALALALVILAVLATSVGAARIARGGLKAAAKTA